MEQQERYNKLFNYIDKEIGKATQPTIIKFIYECLAQLRTILDIMEENNEITLEQASEEKQELTCLEEKENLFVFTWLSNNGPHTWESIFNFLRDTNLSVNRFVK